MKYVALVLALLLIPLPAVAQEVVEIELHYMPPGEKVWLPESNAWGRGFDLTGYKLLLKMDEDLFSANAQVKVLMGSDLKWIKVIEGKDTVITTLKSDRAVLEVRADRLMKSWQASEKARVEEAGGPLWPYVLAAVGASVGLAGVIWGVVAQSSAK